MRLLTCALLFLSLLCFVGPAQAHGPDVLVLPQSGYYGTYGTVVTPLGGFVTARYEYGPAPYSGLYGYPAPLYSPLYQYQPTYQQFLFTGPRTIIRRNGTVITVFP